MMATLFVNPRPSSIADNRMNFPSKILEYLSYAKPVVSTWTPGLSPEYEGVLVVVEQETPECMARKIEEVLSWDAEKHSAWSERITAFVTGRKLWDLQAGSLLRWLSTIK
jgi:glycosyltransferase involved in cell wall biosynthesis